MPLREDGTYVITGGLGDLGLALADWMVTRGARRLVLVGRTARRSSAVQALEERGARVLVAAADVADQPAMEALFARLREEGGPAPRRDPRRRRGAPGPAARAHGERAQR